MNKYLEKLKNDYEKIWSNLDNNSYHVSMIETRHKKRSVYYNVFEKYLKNNIKSLVLEIGCGTGIDLNIISKKNKNIIPFASDISSKSIQICKKVSEKLENKVNMFAGDTLLLPIKSNIFDVVFSQGLIEHFKNPMSVVNEHHRILKPGGYLIINVPQKFTGYALMKKSQIRKKKWKLGWETSFSYKDLQKIIEKLNLIEVEVCGYQYWKSWKEPIFVLRDLYDKFQRRNPFQNYNIFQILKKLYDSFWLMIERKWGHYFLQNIVIVFQKK